jgi:hypothetical protein
VTLGASHAAGTRSSRRNVFGLLSVSPHALDAQTKSTDRAEGRHTADYLVRRCKLIMSLPEPHDRNPNWQLAGDLLLATSAGDEAAFDQVGFQLRIALKREGLI